MNVVLPLISTIISFVFATLVFDQFLNRRKPYQLVWTIGCIWFGFSAFTELYGNLQGWNPSLYRYWYLIGACYVAAYLGMGTTYLLIPRRFAHVVMALLLVASVYAAYTVLSAPVNAALLPKAGEIVTADALPTSARFPMPMILNIFGAGALFIGALYSAIVFVRHRILPHRVVSNLIIAAGTIIISSTGTLSRIGRPELFFLGELLGVLIIFLGFLVSIEVFEQFRVPFTRITFGQRGVKPVETSMKRDSASGSHK